MELLWDIGPPNGYESAMTAMVTLAMILQAMMGQNGITNRSTMCGSPSDLNAHL